MAHDIVIAGDDDINESGWLYVRIQTDAGQDWWDSMGFEVVDQQDGYMGIDPGTWDELIRSAREAGLSIGPG